MTKVQNYSIFIANIIYKINVLLIFVPRLNKYVGISVNLSIWLSYFKIIVSKCIDFL